MAQARRLGAPQAQLVAEPVPKTPAMTLPDDTKMTMTPRDALNDNVHFQGHAIANAADVARSTLSFWLCHGIGTLDRHNPFRWACSPLPMQLVPHVLALPRSLTQA